MPKTLKKKRATKNKTIKKLHLKNKYTIVIKSKKIESKLKKYKKGKTMRYNEQLIQVLNELQSLYRSKGSPFGAMAFSKASDSILLYSDDITDPSQLQNIKGIGKSTFGKLKTFIETGKLDILEKAKNNPIHKFIQIYGVGPKKAKELHQTHKITSIQQLRENPELLNDKQLIGLKHYEDILKRIPRKEIEVYETKLKNLFNKVKNKDSTFQIVGSYRRGATDSGDIDIIISDPLNDVNVFNKFLDKLIEKKILIEVLSRGDVKSLGVSKLRGKPSRRIDFMFSPKKEYAFAVLYFTGSKDFNTAMRGRALKKGYSMNEHCFHIMVNGQKKSKLKKYFPDEKSIFNFLDMEYKEPWERQTTNAVVIVKKNKKVKKLKNLTLKKITKTSQKLINEFLNDGIQALNNCSETQLSSMIRAANKGYYCNDKQLMTDSQYDMLKEYIEEKYPNNVAIQEGHTECIVSVEKKKVELPYEMWSLDKEKEAKNVDRRMKKYKGDHVISVKADGISAMYIFQNSDNKQLYSRGNGKIGQDLSLMAPYLKLPDFETMSTDIVIRGELIIKKQTFDEKYKKKFANPRNFVSGAANAKKMNTKMVSDLDFLAYEVVSPVMKPSEQMKFLEKHFGNTAIKHVVAPHTKVNATFLSEKLLDWRENYDWEMDGVVIYHDKLHPRTTGNPKHAFAFKMVLSDQIVESRVYDVIWNPSKDGYLKPKIQIEPVNIGGAKIEFATAHNAAFVYGKNYKNPADGYIGPGAIIQIIRSGDVIPKVHKVIAPALKPKAPDSSYKVKWNNTGIDFILEDKDTNKVVQMKRISAFFEKIEVGGLGRGNVQRIINAGFDTIPKIIIMSYEDFLDVDGFKEKMATKIHKNIKNSMALVKLPTLMAGINIFGRGMGERRIKMILDKFPDILWSKKSEKEKLEMIAELPGFQQKTAMAFVPHIKEFIEFAKEINILARLKKKKSKQFNMSHPLYGKRIVFTGVRDKKLQEKLENIGITISTSVSKNTDFVIVKDIDDVTSKIDTAKEYKIPLFTPDDFSKKYL